MGYWRVSIKINVSGATIKELALIPQNLVFILLASIVIFYFQTVYSLYELWTGDDNWEYSHGPLAFLLAVYIFGRYWVSKPKIEYRADIFGMLLLFGAALLWLVAAIGNIQVLQQLALLALTGFLFWGMFGFSVFSNLFIPLMIMLTAIPVWDFLNIYLQHATVFGVSFFLGFTTIPFLKEGFHIVLPNGAFEVADVCSGLRMLTAIVPVALFYLYQYKIRWQVGLLFVLAAILAAVLANTIRILIVVIAGYLTEMKHYFVTTDHVMLGWVVFGIIVLGFIFLSNKVLLSNRMYPRVRAMKKNNEENSQMDTTSTVAVYQSKNRLIGILGLGLLTVGIGPVVAGVLSYSDKQVSRQPIGLLSSYGDWKDTKLLSNNLNPEYHGFTFDKHSQYKNASEKSVELNLVYYYSQSQGKEAIYYKNRPFDAKKWKITSVAQTEKQIGGVGNIEVLEYKIQSIRGNRKLVWQWYYSAGQRTNSNIKTKFFEIVGKFTGKPAVSVFILATDLDDEYTSAVDRLSNFLFASLESIEKEIDQVR